MFWASLYAKVFFYFQLLKNMRFWIILLEIFGKKLHEVFQLYRVVLALIFLRKTKGALSLDLTLIYLLRPVHELKLSDCPWLSVAGVRHFKLPQQVLRHVIFSQRIHHKALKYWNIIACQNFEGGGSNCFHIAPYYLTLFSAYLISCWTIIWPILGTFFPSHLTLKGNISLVSWFRWFQCFSSN